MSTRRADIWSKWLWEHYEKYVASGQPFYLAADGSLIREILSKGSGLDVSIEEAIDDFHSTCLSLLERTSSKAIVKEIAFEPISGLPYSRVICLAVQQVLVVELMLNDSMFSENSYFPRYREVLDLGDAYDHMNPLGTGYFQEIWSTLEREIRKIEGSNSSTVTFFAGTSRRDLNRMLPFTQALFTTHDLTIIRERAPRISGDMDEKIILQAIYRVRPHLGRRAQVLIGTADPIKKGRLCKQVQSFLTNYDRISTLRPRSVVSSSSEGEFVGYLDSDDIFEDTHSIYLRRSGTQVTGTELETPLAAVLEEKGVVLLVSRSDAYLEVSKLNQIVAGDAVLAIIYRWRATEFNSHISQLYGSCAEQMFTPERTNLGNKFLLFKCDSAKDARLNALIGFRNSPDLTPTIELKGGLLADGRTKIFLAGYAPTSICLRGKELARDANVISGDRSVSVGALLDELASQEGFRPYSIKIGDAKLDFAVSDHNSLPSSAQALGYIIEGNELGLSPQPLEEHEAGLRGTRFIDGPAPRVEAQASQLNRNDLIALMARGKRMAVHEADLRALLNEVKSYPHDPQVATFVRKHLELTRSIPCTPAAYALIRRLAKAVS